MPMQKVYPYAGMRSSSLRGTLGPFASAMQSTLLVALPAQSKSWCVVSDPSSAPAAVVISSPSRLAGKGVSAF